MHADQFDALLTAAAEGVSLDGLVVDRASDGYRFETPTLRRVGLSETDLHAVADANPRFVSNWYYWTHEVGSEPTARRAFLRWVEGADERSVRDRYALLDDGATRTWGQLHLGVTLGDDGERRYHLRHVDDAESDADALDASETPEDARDLVKLDRKGRYRPLKTAPSLVTGWRFSDLDGTTFVRVVDAIYPATVANWHREHRGDLDVTHWAQTAARQTGIYAVVDDLSDEAVEWVAEACCVDSQCLKRREWDVDPDSPLDAPRGDGVFPCREPCSLVVAAARSWTNLEAEPTRTYEFALTPSEKAQVEGLIDAVADGRVDDVREADVSEGANRYRARYLRAKRFDEDGNLSGTPTDE